MFHNSYTKYHCNDIHTNTFEKLQTYLHIVRW